MSDDDYYQQKEGDLPMTKPTDGKRPRQPEGTHLS